GTAPAAPISDIDDEGEEGGKGRKGGRGAAAGGGVAGRADRHKERSERQARRKAEAEIRGGVSGLDDDSPRNRKHRERKHKQPPTVARKGKIPVEVPITVRSLSEAIGRKSGEVLLKLMGHGAGAGININSTLSPEQAELVALDFGCELEIKHGTDV